MFCLREIDIQVSVVGAVARSVTPDIILAQAIRIAVD